MFIEIINIHNETCLINIDNVSTIRVRNKKFITIGCCNSESHYEEIKFDSEDGCKNYYNLLFDFISESKDIIKFGE